MNRILSVLDVRVAIFTTLAFAEAPLPVPISPPRFTSTFISTLPFRPTKHSHSIRLIAAPPLYRQIYRPPRPLHPLHRPPRSFHRRPHTGDIYAPPCLIEEHPEEISHPLPTTLYSVPPAAPLIEQNNALYLEMPPSLPNVPAILAHELEQKRGWISRPHTPIPFTLGKAITLHPRLWPEMEEVTLLTVSSPALEAFREASLLPRRIGGHPFSLLLSARPRQRPTTPPLCRLNVSCHAA